MIIDKSLPKYADDEPGENGIKHAKLRGFKYPASLEGEVLLENTVDSKGEHSGFLTIKPEYLKHYADTKTPVELKALGFEKFGLLTAQMKARADIVAEVPPVKVV